MADEAVRRAAHTLCRLCALSDRFREDETYREVVLHLMTVIDDDPAVIEWLRQGVGYRTPFDRD